MIIPIDETYRIKSDTTQWMLQRKSISKGEEAWTSFKYFNDPGMCIQSLIHLKIRLSNADTLAKALRDIDNISTSVLGALTPSFKVEMLP